MQQSSNPSADPRAPVSSPPSSTRGRPPWNLGRVLLAGSIPLAAVAFYAVLISVPAFQAYTHDGLAALGLFPTRYDPGCREPIVTEHGRFLWGGADPDDHFDITVFRLDTDRLHYGLGRERFPALVEPRFVPVAEILAARPGGNMGLSLTGGGKPLTAETNPKWPGDLARVLTVKVGDDVRIYPLTVLRRNELVNDVVGGTPIFAAYCSLANLAAAYDRRFGDHVLTFAVSGYTYWDPDVWDGRDAFVLWDRDTESLWWPPLGKAVSGPMMDTPMTLLDEGLWSQGTFGDAHRKYPDALVLEANQPFDPPVDWPRLESVPAASTRPGRSIAPRWGNNRGLSGDDG